MICVVCRANFEAKRLDAKFCSDACRKKYARGIMSDIKADIPSEIIKADTVENVRDNIPNWKRNGFVSKEAAMKYAIALTLKRVPEASISWSGRNWTKEDFGSLKGLEPLF